MERNHNINWRKGNGEILGFAVSIALLFLIMVSLIYFTGYTTQHEQLTVATYCAGRAAAVSQSPGLATSRANAVIRSIYPDGGAKVSIRSNGDWKKGNLFEVEVAGNLPTLGLGGAWSIQLGKQERVCTLTMMIEGESK